MYEYLCVERANVTVVVNSRKKQTTLPDLSTGHVNLSPPNRNIALSVDLPNDRDEKVCLVTHRALNNKDHARSTFQRDTSNA